MAKSPNVASPRIPHNVLLPIVAEYENRNLISSDKFSDRDLENIRDRLPSEYQDIHVGPLKDKCLGIRKNGKMAQWREDNNSPSPFRKGPKRRGPRKESIVIREFVDKLRGILSPASMVIVSTAMENYLLSK